MAVNFPENPSIDDLFDSDGFVYQWDGVKWISIGGLNIADMVGDIPSGTRLLFMQQNPPTGYTIDNNYGDHAIRIKGSESWSFSGGSVDFTTAFKSQSISMSGSSDATSPGGGGNTSDVAASLNVSGTSLLGSQMPSHSHKYWGTNGNDKGSGGWQEGFWGKQNTWTDTAGGGGTHTHGGNTAQHNHYAYSTADTHKHTFSESTSLNLTVKYANSCIGVKN